MGDTLYAHSSRRATTRALVSLLAGGVMLSTLLPLNALTTPARAAQQQEQICRRVSDFDVCGRFLQEWSKQGSDQASVYVNGLPITARRAEISVVDGKSYDTQWFERAKFEAHPENKAPYDVLFGLLGVSLTEGRGRVDPYTKKVRNPADAAFVGIDKPADADGKSRVWFPETRHSVSGKILQYWNQYGGLPQFGFPLSEQFQEISEADGKTYTVQYFERNRFELHPEKAAPYEVELGLLGVQQYRMTPTTTDILAGAPPRGVTSSRDTLVIGISSEPQSLYFYASDANTTLIPLVLYRGLIGQDAHANYVGEVAWYAPTVENGGARFVGAGENRYLQVKYKLRQGMKWSDGVEITSTDALYYYQYAMNPDTPIEREGFEKLFNMDNPDRYTVIANYMSYAQVRDFYNGTDDKDHFSFLKPFVDQKRPVSDRGYLFAAMSSLLPEHILGKVPVTKHRELGYWTDPNLLIGNGPFKVQQWERGRQIVLVPNPNYTITAPPLLKRIVLRIIPDRVTLIAQLKAGDVDAVYSGVFPAPDEQLAQLEKAGLTVVNQPGSTWEHLDFNLDLPFFREKAVRQAIAYAISRQQIVDTVSQGKWLVLDTYAIVQSWASMQNPDFPGEWKEKFPLKRYPYDPAKANQMLDAAGWVKGPDGIRAKGGVRLSFKYETTDAPVRVRVQSLVRADLRAVGIDARSSQLPSNKLFSTLATRDFDLAEFAWIVNDDGSGGSSIYTSGNIPSLENEFVGANYAGFRNARVDQLSYEDNAELDRSKRYPMQAELQSIISEELPVLPLFQRTGIMVHNPKLVNWGGYDFWPLGRAAALYFK